MQYPMKRAPHTPAAMALFRPTIFSPTRSGVGGGGARKAAVASKPSERTAPLSPEARREGRGKAGHASLPAPVAEALGDVRGSA